MWWEWCRGLFPAGSLVVLLMHGLGAEVAGARGSLHPAVTVLGVHVHLGIPRLRWRWWWGQWVRLDSHVDGERLGGLGNSVCSGGRLRGGCFGL